MSKRLLFVVLALALMGALVVTAAAQDTPSLTVSDQVSSGSVVIDQVVSDGPGWVVVRGAGGRGTPGPVMGQTSVPAGVSENVVVDLNLDLATRQLFAALHADDTNEGAWDFGLEAGADAPVEVDGEAVQQLFTAYIIDMTDQPVAEDNTVFADTVVMNEAGWLVIHSDDNGQPGPVLGFAPVRAGRNADVTVEIDSEGRTDVLWPMLHVDTGAAGEYEFGTVEGADAPVVQNGEVATFPIWTVPHVRMSEQTVGADDAGTPTVFVESVLSSGPGFIVIHSEADGRPGPVLGFAPVTDGLNTDITVALDQGVALTPVVWPMLHADTGTEGEYEFGTVEGADLPVRDADDNVITFAVNLSGVEGAAAPQTTPEAAEAAGDATGTCAIAARSEQGANIRSAPSMDSAVVGTLSGAQSRSPLGVTTQDASGFRWYQLSGNTWVRADVVTTTGACDRLPTASAEATPEATAGA